MLNEPLKRPSTESAVGQVFDSHKVFGAIVPITQDRNNIENKPWDEVYMSQGRSEQSLGSFGSEEEKSNLEVVIHLFLETNV